MEGTKEELKQAGILDLTFLRGYTPPSLPHGREIGRLYKMNYARDWRTAYPLQL
jgi:hypothetical protein